MLGSRSSISDTLKRSTVVNFTTPTISNATGLTFGAITQGYNIQYNDVNSLLNWKRELYQARVEENLLNDPTFDGYRSKGVELAREYDKFDILMGGSGSRNYTLEQRIELIENGSVSGFEGHHINNVADNLDMQANPDNIIFYADRQEHLQSGHHGDFGNSSNGKLIDRNQMLRRTNNKRVLQNELTGLGVSAVLGFGVGFSISAIMELAQSGLSAVDIPYLLKNSLKSAIESAVLASASYIGGRVLSTLMERVGFDFLSLSANVINFSMIGLLSIAITSVYQYIKLRVNGADAKESMNEVGKQIAISLLSLSASVLASCLFGGVAGLVVSVGISVVYIGVNVGKSIYGRKFEEKLRNYTIEQYKPVYLN